MLKYIGSGFIVGIPARDLSDEEVENCGGAEFLISTGLYEKPKKFKAEKPKTKEGE